MTTTHAPAVTAESPAPATPPGVPARLIVLRLAYRNGLITLGEFLAYIDRFLDGVPLDGPIPTTPVPPPPPPPEAKSEKPEKVEKEKS